MKTYTVKLTEESYITRGRHTLVAHVTVEGENEQEAKEKAEEMACEEDLDWEMTDYWYDTDCYETTVEVIGEGIGPIKTIRQIINEGVEAGIFQLFDSLVTSVDFFAVSRAVKSLHGDMASIYEAAHAVVPKAPDDITPVEMEAFSVQLASVVRSAYGVNAPLTVAVDAAIPKIVEHMKEPAQ